MQLTFFNTKPKAIAFFSQKIAFCLHQFGNLSQQFIASSAKQSPPPQNIARSPQRFGHSLQRNVFFPQQKLISLKKFSHLFQQFIACTAKQSPSPQNISNLPEQFTPFLQQITHLSRFMLIVSASAQHQRDQRKDLRNLREISIL